MRQATAALPRPQSHETRAEIKEIMAVPHNIVSPQVRAPGLLPLSLAWLWVDLAWEGHFCRALLRPQGLLACPTMEHSAFPYQRSAPTPSRCSPLPDPLPTRSVPCLRGAGQQAGDGDCAGHAAGQPALHQARHLHREGPAHEPAALDRGAPSAQRAQQGQQLLCNMRSWGSGSAGLPV